MQPKWILNQSYYLRNYNIFIITIMTNYVSHSRIRPTDIYLNVYNYIIILVGEESKGVVYPIPSLPHVCPTLQEARLWEIVYTPLLHCYLTLLHQLLGRV